ncbi:hypothetical protein RB653_005729 [Dictyostelium firmibasis]|uniref:Protein kinase domain-containing protein n=1 Tax=Dictyostelium firmibasis TaxID=79012 RepID=A0AAN7Z1E6_9MYCE
MDLKYILNHNNINKHLISFDYEKIKKNKLDFKNNSDIIDIGKKNVKQSNNNELMLPPPTLITPLNQDETLTLYHSGRSISVPRKMLIDPNTISNCGTNGLMFIAYNCEIKNKVVLKKISKNLIYNEIVGHGLIRNLIYQRVFKGSKHILTFKSVFKRKCSESYVSPSTTTTTTGGNQINEFVNQQPMLIQQRDDEDIYFESIQPHYSFMNLISNNKMVINNEDNFRRLFYELLSGLKFMHSSGVIHRDLDPESSIFVDENMNVFFTDFRNCFLLDCPTNLFNKEYVTYSYSYRAPETVWGDSVYSEAVDVWGVGVLFAEILLGRRLFRTFTGRDHLKSICKLIGAPNASEQAYIQKRELLKFVRDYSKGRNFQPSFQDTFMECSPIHIELLKSMLCWDPRDRLSVDELLEHPYFDKIHQKTMYMPCIKKLTVESHVDLFKMKPDEMIDLIDQEFLIPC